MPDFNVRAKTTDGRQVTQVVSADNIGEAREKISSSNLYPLDIKEVTRSSVDINNITFGASKVSTLKIAIFCRQLATMLGSGITLVESFDTLCKKTDDKNLQKILYSVYESLQKGNSLYDSLRAQGKAFPILLVNMVKAGESSGSLDVIMEKMAAHYEHDYNLMKKAKSAMVYPMILVIITVAIIIGIFVFVMPSFIENFKNLEIPAITQVMMDISSFLVNRWYVLVVVVVILSVIWMVIVRIPAVQTFKDKAKLAMPGFKKVFKALYSARFTSAMFILYSSGVSILESLDISIDILSNSYMTKAFQTVSVDIRKGGKFATSIERTEIFDPMMNSMLHIGENSGNLETIFKRMSAFYEDESERTIAGLVAVIEPLMIIIMAVIVLCVLLSVMLPMFQGYLSATK